MQYALRAACSRNNIYISIFNSISVRTMLVAARVIVNGDTGSFYTWRLRKGCQPRFETNQIIMFFYGKNQLHSLEVIVLVQSTSSSIQTFLGVNSSDPREVSPTFATWRSLFDQINPRIYTLSNKIECGLGYCGFRPFCLAQMINLSNLTRSPRLAKYILEQTLAVIPSQ